MSATPDLKLIADMLAQLIWRTNGENPLCPFAVKSIEEQAELCRAADEDEARRVGTGVVADEPMYGALLASDFTKDTMTFEMRGEYLCAAGLYEIRRHKPTQEGGGNAN